MERRVALGRRGAQDVGSACVLRQLLQDLHFPMRRGLVQLRIHADHASLFHSRLSKRQKTGKHRDEGAELLGMRI